MMNESILKIRTIDRIYFVSNCALARSPHCLNQPLTDWHPLSQHPNDPPSKRESKQIREPRLGYTGEKQASTVMRKKSTPDNLRSTILLGTSPNNSLNQRPRIANENPRIPKDQLIRHSASRSSERDSHRVLLGSYAPVSFALIPDHCGRLKRRGTYSSHKLPNQLSSWWFSSTPLSGCRSR